MYLRSIVFVIVCSSIIRTYAQSAYRYKDPKQPLDIRVEDLLSRMSLEEKVYLLTATDDTLCMGDKSVGWLGFMDYESDAAQAAKTYNQVASYMKNKTKYGFVAFRTGEGIFAYMGNGGTAFPQPLAQAASWDIHVVRTVASVVGAEASSRGVRMLFSPVLNMGRDPRWGRTGETYGEDPLLVSKMGAAYIKTMEAQGIATTMKHFAGNTGHDGKFGSAVFYSERYYREFEFIPYEVGIKEANTSAIMMAYNTGDGIAFAQNQWMMQEYLKKELGFKGVIMSDGDGLKLIDEVFGIDTNDVELVAKCINSGCDWALDDPKYYKNALLKAYAQGKVSEQTITESARRTLRIMFKSGLYDQPFVSPEHAKKVNNCEDHRNAAYKVALQTTVLLKNQKQTLPLGNTIKRVLVTGQLGNKLLINHYGGWGREETTILDGIKKVMPNLEVEYQLGAYVGYTFYPTIESEYFFHIKNGSKEKGLLASYFANTSCQGSPIYVKTDTTIDFDWGMDAPLSLPNDNFSIQWTGFLKVPFSGLYTFGSHADNGLSVYINDSLVVDMRNGPQYSIFASKGQIYLEKDKEYAFRATYFETGGKAFVRLGWDAFTRKHIQAAVDAGRHADAIVVVAGMYDDENGDRAILNLDEAQEDLILNLAKIGKPVVVVLQSGNVITMRRWADKVPAILHAWYPGQEGGRAVAEILFGKYNPGAKLPITIPSETGQVPINYNKFPGKDTKPVDRGIDKFIDVGNEPMFYFGHGLSYTTFSLSGFSFSKNVIYPNDSVVVHLHIKNTGKMAGAEVIQLYTHTEQALVSRPVLELKNFVKVNLEPGQSKKITLVLKAEQLLYFDENFKRTFPEGYVSVMIGTASNNIVYKNYIRCRPKE